MFETRLCFITIAYTVLIYMALKQKDMIKLMPELFKGINNLKELQENQEQNLLVNDSDKDK